MVFYLLVYELIICVNFTGWNMIFHMLRIVISLSRNLVLSWILDESTFYLDEYTCFWCYVTNLTQSNFANFHFFYFIQDFLIFMPLQICQKAYRLYIYGDEKQFLETSYYYYYSNLHFSFFNYTCWSLNLLSFF